MSNKTNDPPPRAATSRGKPVRTDDSLGYSARINPQISEDARKSVFALPRPPSAPELSTLLSQSVVGQDRATRRLSLLLSLHLAFFDRPAYERHIPNAIIVGPTGVGKTLSMRTLASAFSIPFVVVDTTSLVPAGIVGVQVEDIMRRLYDAAEKILEDTNHRSLRGDIVSLAERGVVFLDEFDKIATPHGAENASDAPRRLVQRRLLKMVEGDNVRVGVTHRDGGLNEDVFLNTSRLLVVAGGAFADLPQRVAGKRRNVELYREMVGDSAIVSEDIRIYGFMPELAARLPFIIQFNSLTARDLLMIMASSPESPLQMWKEYAEQCGVRLEITPRAMSVIAQRAALLNVGARGLPQLLSPFLADRFSEAFASGTSTVTITDEELQPKGALYTASESAWADTKEEAPELAKDFAGVAEFD